MTVKTIIEKIEEIDNFIDDLDQAGSVTFEESDAMLLSDILTEYRDMLLEMKVQMN